MLTLFRKVSLPHFRANWGRSALIVAGTMTGVALIVAINIINVSVLENFQRTIQSVAGPASLEVTLGTGEIGFSEDTTEIVRQDPEVLAAVPLVRGTIAPTGRSGETLALFGADLVGEAELERYQITLKTDRRTALEALTDPRAVLISERFSQGEGLGVGDAMEVAAPSGIVSLTIRGLVTEEGLARTFGGRLAVMDLPAAQLLLGKEGRIDQLDVIVKPGADIETVQARVRTRLPSTLTVERPERRGLLYDRIISSFQALLSGLSLLCLVAGVYIIYNTTSTGAVHRALVIAGLRVTGASLGQLFRLLLSEALLLGIVGTLLGILTGIILARLLTGLIEETMGVVFQLRFPIEALTTDLSQQAVIGTIGIGATLFASYFAARRVTRLSPLEVFRADLRTLSARTPSTKLVAWWVVLVAISATALALEIRYKSADWGNFASTLWFASSIVIAVPLVAFLSAALDRLLTHVFGAEGMMAGESLGRAPTRTGVTVAAIALVLTVGISIASMAHSHRESVREQVLGGVLACDLAVSAVATEGGWLESPLPASLVSELTQVPGVSQAESWRVLPGHLYRDSRVALVGVSDGLLDPHRYPPGWYVVGDAESAAPFLRNGSGAVVSEAFADRFDVSLHDEVALNTPIGVLKLRVVGIMRDYVSDRGAVWFSSRLFRDYWKDSAVSWVLVFARERASITRLRSDIAAALGQRYRLKILSMRDLDSYLTAKIDRAYAFTFAIQLLIAIVTAAGIFDLLLAAIWERRRELALWRVIGADERTVRRSVILESAVIGAVGSLLGLLVGIVTTLIWIHAHYRHLLGYYLQLHFPYWPTVWYVALIMTMTVVAGYAAARYATRQSVLQGIQAE